MNCRVTIKNLLDLAQLTETRTFESSSLDIDKPVVCCLYRSIHVSRPRAGGLPQYSTAGKEKRDMNPAVCLGPRIALKW